jgi:hypothetical protein
MGCSQIAAAPNVSDQRNKPLTPMWTRAKGAIARTASPKLLDKSGDKEPRRLL